MIAQQITPISGFPTDIGKDIIQPIIDAFVQALQTIWTTLIDDYLLSGSTIQIDVYTAILALSLPAPVIIMLFRKIGGSYGGR